MAAPKRTKFKIEQDRHTITQMYLQQKTQVEIAQALGMTQPMVSYDLAKVREQWLEATTHDLDVAKAKELARIDNLERVHWEQWEHTRKVIHLDGVARCITLRMKLLGLEEVHPISVGSLSEIVTKTYDGESQQLLTEVHQQSIIQLQEINERHRQEGFGHYRTRPMLEESALDDHQS